MVLLPRISGLTREQKVEVLEKLCASTDGSKNRLHMQMEAVTDMLAIIDVFDGGHNGDWRRTVSGVLDCAPLLWSVKGKPKKREELLSHLMRSDLLPASRLLCLFWNQSNLKHLGGACAAGRCAPSESSTSSCSVGSSCAIWTARSCCPSRPGRRRVKGSQPSWVTSRVSIASASSRVFLPTAMRKCCARRSCTTFDLVRTQQQRAQQAGAGSHSGSSRTEKGAAIFCPHVAELIERRARPKAKVASLGVELAMLDDTEAITLMCLYMEVEHDYTDILEWPGGCCDAAAGERLMEEALRRRKRCVRKPMVHLQDTAWADMSLDVMEKSAKKRKALPTQEGSRDYIRSKNYVAGSMKPGPHQGKTTYKWPALQLKQVQRVATEGAEFLPAMMKNSGAAAKWLEKQLPGNYGMSRTRERKEKAHAIASKWTVGDLDEDPE